jgi:hypothetical protein
MIPASPAPTAAWTCDAAPVASGIGDPVAVRLPLAVRLALADFVALADSVAEWTVLFEPVGVALAELAVEVMTGVVEATAATGYS